MFGLRRGSFARRAPPERVVRYLNSGTPVGIPGADMDLKALRSTGLRHIPQAESAFKGMGIFACAATGRQLFEEADITSANYGLRGLERRDQVPHHV
jgi:hypothetical protein